jgi:plastocyanin
MRYTCSFLLAGMTALVAACGGGGGSDYGSGPQNNPPSTSVHNPVQATASFTFDPAEIKISPGDSVTWVFGAIGHNVTFQQEGDSAAYYGGGTSSKGAPANIPTTTNKSVVRAFASAGTFNYRCTIHPGMIGEVKVQ